MTPNPKEEYIRTVCLECRTQCGILVHVKDGQAVELKNDPARPNPKNKICEKSKVALERLNHPDRLRFPLKRAGVRGEGKWERISWDEALSTLAERLLEYRTSHGAESVAFIKGHYDRRCDLVSRLGNTFGTPNIASIDYSCYIPSASGRLMTYGFDGRPDFLGFPDCVMCWGTSALPPLKKDAKFIVVDAIRTKAAEKADIWLQPRPATDLALALGFINVIITEKLYDRAFVEQWTTGFQKLEQHIQQYTPDKVAEITWVPSEKIVAAARLFSSYPYACLQTGNASDDSYNSTQFARAASIIQAILGLLDKSGGTVEGNGKPIDREGTAADVLRDILPSEQMNKKLGREYGHFPVDPLWDTIVNKPAELQPQYLVKSILEKTPYQVQAAVVMGSNPVMTWANSKKVYEAFENIPFLAVADIFITPTASLADIILPSTTYFEADAIIVGKLGHGDTYVQAQQKAVQIGECRSDLEIIISLAKRLGLSQYFWDNPNDYLDAYLKETGITFKELCGRPCHISSGIRYRKYLTNGFNTPSGKVELYSRLCEKWGFEPLPVYHEPKETHVSAPELAKEYPLILTSAHDQNYAHSQDRMLDFLRAKYPDPLVVIHPLTANKLGIADGEAVYIENKRGKIKQRAKLSDVVDPRVIWPGYGWWFPEKGASSQYGWDDANLNILTDDSTPCSPEIGSPTMRGFLCKIYKADT